jgi:hypothetical protein
MKGMTSAKAPRTAIPVDIKLAVLHQAGYKCGNPVCRTLVTLDIHHLAPVSKGGKNDPDNLLVLCPNCHRLHHHGEIPLASLRAWKMLLLALNEAFDRRSIDLLLTLESTSPLVSGGEGVLECAALIAAGLVRSESQLLTWAMGPPSYVLCLTEKGRAFVASWRAGDQRAAVTPGPGLRAG